MKEKLYFNTELIAYFLWEYTKHANALDLWYCAEDICFFLEKHDYLNVKDILEIIGMPSDDREYINFIRNIAYRVYIFTGDNDRIKNWFIAEKLLKNDEWLKAVCEVSGIYSTIRGECIQLSDFIRSEQIRKNF